MKFLEMLKWIPAAFKLLGALVPLVKGLIEGFETPGNGELKKQAVLDAVGKVLDEANTPEAVKKFVLWAVGWLIDAIVAIKNAVGEFVHGSEGAQ